MRKSYKNKRTKGGNGPLPLKYFDVNAESVSAPAGHDLLKASGMLIRPKIGGKRKTRKTKGGFVPSVMEGFVTSVSKYITPLVLFATYKLINSKKDKSKTRRK